MRSLLTRLFTSTHIVMASSSFSSSPSRRLVHLTRHLVSSSSGELSSVGAPAAAASDADPVKSPRSTASRVHAAVLVCLFEDPSSGPRVLLTKRASSLSSHSGRHHDSG
uniref:Nudix hydrolase domain-containing protein n=1 Tax=Zea mays TaxID=4577 RepID=C0PNA1_MAIZE|nr:unknown [Zea mays]